MNTIHPDSMTLESDASSIQRRDVLTRTLELIGERKEMACRTRERIARENRASATAAPKPNDPRLAMISETVHRLQGTILTPEDRSALLAFGRARGLRAFDSNLLIAMVQDRARRGETPGAIPLAQTMAPAMETPRTLAGEPGKASITSRLLLATVGALCIATLAATWLIAGA
jgi:hypothetical protein